MKASVNIITKQKTEKDQVFQNISNQESKELNNLIKNKNISVCINDTDKNMGAEDADKTDVISECERQLGTSKLI